MKLIKWLDKYIEVVIIVTSSIIIVTLMSLQIFMRKVAGFSISWIEECTTHLFTLIAFAGIAYSLKTDSAIKFDLIITFCGEKFKHIFLLISNVIVAAFFLYLLPSWFAVIGKYSAQSAILMPYTLGFLYSVMGCCVLLSAVRAIQQIIWNIKQLRHSEDKEEGKEEKGGVEP